MLAEEYTAIIDGEPHILGYFNDEIGCSFQAWRIPYDEFPIAGFKATENHYWMPIKHLFKEVKKDVDVGFK